MFGPGVGMFMSPFFVSNVRGLVFLVQALLATVPLPLGALVFDRRKLSEFWTPAPRGEGAAAPVSVCAFFLASAKRVAKSGPMLHLLLMIALAVGTAQTILNLLNIACQPSFKSPSSTCVLALSLFGSALLGGSAVSLFADRLPWDNVEVLRRPSRSPWRAGTPTRAWLVVGGMVATGFFSFGLVPLTIELGVEDLYSPSAPNVEASVVGLITIAYDLGTSLLLYISTPGNVMSSRNLAIALALLLCCPSASSAGTTRRRPRPELPSPSLARLSDLCLASGKLCRVSFSGEDARAPCRRVAPVGTRCRCLPGAAARLYPVTAPGCACVARLALKRHCPAASCAVALCLPD
jgi:hypothetical protein